MLRMHYLALALALMPSGSADGMAPQQGSDRVQSQLRGLTAVNVFVSVGLGVPDWSAVETALERKTSEHLRRVGLEPSQKPPTLRVCIWGNTDVRLRPGDLQILLVVELSEPGRVLRDPTLELENHAITWRYHMAFITDSAGVRSAIENEVGKALDMFGSDFRRANR